MTGGALPERFKTANTAGLPDLGQLDERGQIFWALRVGQEQLDITMMTPAEVSNVLRDAFGILISRQKIESILCREKSTVAKRKTKGTRAYQLMDTGRKELEGVGNAVIFIEPTTAYSKLRETQSLFAALRGDLRVCDPYVDERTLDMLASCTNAKLISLLTVNVSKPAGIKQSIKAFTTEHGIELKVRVVPKGILHDRYLIDDTVILAVGTSLNGLGLKQTMVIALGEDMRAMAVTSFDSMWTGATPL